MLRIQTLLLIALVACLIGSCGGTGNGAVIADTGQPAPGFSGVLAFPVDRELAALSTATLDGAAAVDRSSGAVDSGTSVLLTATPAAAEFVVYTFNPNNTPNQISVTVDEAQTDSYWIALANYTRTRWELDGPYATSQGFALGADHLSPLGNFSIAIIAPPGDTAQIDLLQLSSNNDAPTAALTASADGPAPLTVNFDAGASTDAEGAIAKYEWEYEAGAGFVSTGTTAVSTHNYLTQGTYIARVRVTDEGGLIDTASVTVNATAPINTPPVAALTGPGKAAAPINNAVFDASGSSDPDPNDSITNYSWDLDNDRAYNDSPAENAVEGDSSVTLNFANPGSYTVNVRVYDETGGLGGTDTASFTVVATGWKYATVSAVNHSGWHALWLAEIDDAPGIAYQYIDQGAGTREVRYAYSSTATGSNDADWSYVSVPGILHGGSLSLAEVNGTPAITYYGDFRIKYVRSSTPTGANPADWTGINPDPQPGVGYGFNSSLAIINGNPAIAYQGHDENTSYVYSTTIDGMSSADWSTPVVIDGAGWSSGGQVSLAAVNGSPAIAYRDSEPGSSGIKYARANNATGTPSTAWTGGGSAKLLLESGSSYGSLCVVNGNPAVAFTRYPMMGDVDLYYGYSTTASGGTFGDWTIVGVDTGADLAGTFPVLRVINGKPAISSFSDDPNNDILYTAASTATGAMAADWPANSTPVETNGNLHIEHCLAPIGGRAAIAYYDDTSGDLKYAILFE